MLDFGSGVVANCWQLLKEQLLLLLRSGWIWMRWCPAVAQCSTAAREGYACWWQVGIGLDLVMGGTGGGNLKWAGWSAGGWGFGLLSHKIQPASAFDFDCTRRGASNMAKTIGHMILTENAFSRTFH